MSDFESESFPENEWDECSDLVWNEFDWERYLREQDDVLHRYLGCYEHLKGHSERLDEVAHLMGWDTGQRGADPADGGGLPSDDRGEPVGSRGSAPIEPYTLHKNPVFIATKALYLSLKRGWERLAVNATTIPQPLALTVQTSFQEPTSGPGSTMKTTKEIGDGVQASFLALRCPSVNLSRLI